MTSRSSLGFGRRVHRSTLLTSVAGICMLASAGAAQANETNSGKLDISGVEIAAQGASTGATFNPLLEAQTGTATGSNYDPLLEAQGTGGYLNYEGIVPISQIVVSAPATPTTAIDPVNITGVGQMIIDEQNGFISLCTGTLINPRTVIFAAHCVNERAANLYGQDSGGVPIGFGFGVNNNVSGASAFGGYLNGNTTGGEKYTTNIARYMYDANYVAYNPLSLAGNSGGFRQADVALASFDSPVVGPDLKPLPTWALLFSALPQPASIGAAGTGYHVNIEGYGNNGTGTTGSTGGIDYRRRLADNILGGLASLDDFTAFLFGSPSQNLPQNLYWIDFDDPRRGTSSASPYDFNVWRDNATPKEGITASGDSGGPLILDATYTKQLVIGVLSGGYTRFYTPQPANGYGTASFYQPLYLYWDYIAANNPYHYVSNLAGDANWNSATHWTTLLDPNYYILTGGAAVNGIPTNPGTGIADTGGEFGQECFQDSTSSDCYDYKTGVETYDPSGHPIGTDGTTDAPAIVSKDALSGDSSNDGAKVSSATLEAQSSGGDTQSEAVTAQAVTPAALPAATLANGLPGATNFVPNNNDGNRLTNTAPRYFDVALTAAGTTTLDSSVTVDRFRLNGSGANLTIASTGSLTSLIDVTQGYTSTSSFVAPILTVNGTLTSVGDFFAMNGTIAGSGTITTPNLTSTAATFIPATAGTIGTLNVRGNLIMGNGTLTLIDLGAGGTSDKIAVAVVPGATTATSGQLNVGGAVAFGDVSGTKLKQGDTFTILTSAGARTGTFSASSAFVTGILKPTLTYTANAVTVQLVAGSYADLASSPVTAAYGRLLDQNRSQYAAFSSLFVPLDAQNSGTIEATLESLAPTSETLKGQQGLAMLETTAQFFRNRADSLSNGDAGGTVAMIGKPIQVAALAGTTGTIQSDVGNGTVVQEGKLPENMSAFVAAGYLTGHSSPMSTAITTGNDNFDGYYVAGGVESRFGSSTIAGAAFSYTDTDGHSALGTNSSTGKLYQGTVYGNTEFNGGVTLSGVLSLGIYDTATVRNVSIVGTPYTLRGSDNPHTYSGEINLGYRVHEGDATIMPEAGFRASQIGFHSYSETGGAPALRVTRGAFKSQQARVGLTMNGATSIFRPFASAHFVHEFLDRPASFGANFVGGVGPNASFALVGNDRNWFEGAVGITYSHNNVSFSLAANGEFERSDVQSQSYSASLSFRF